MVKFPEDDIKKAEWLLEQTKKNNGLAPLDIEKFWQDQEDAQKNPFSEKINQVPLGIFYSWEPIFDELGIKEDFWRFENDIDWRLSLIKKYNDKAELIIGKRILNESPPPSKEKQYPPVKKLHDIFEAKNIWHNGSWWLEQSATNEIELENLLNRVEKRLENLRDFILPKNWETEKKRLTEEGIKPPLYRHQRGPCTFATSIYGVENTLFLIIDNPELATRFRDNITKAILELAKIIDEEAGYDQKTAPHGFSFADDNCCLFNPEMYEFFGLPILKSVFERYCPAPQDWRFQHSDSNMAHLLPLLSTLNLSGVNFGPTLSVSEIRNYCPNAIIYGQLAPFTFSRNEELNMICEFLRDFREAKEKRGLVFTTAGSINNGSRLSGMRILMSAAQMWGRYEQ
ncbi:MAG TPA: uroporphyrinogen decarboxylase family protein [Victivallales bacterium]|nr:uroporphyrinogen decarboxylase family protein [Victivallales bacterium]HPO90889.1 uroporphyrinogen decarboxylase family protein [Victivallales bacterium]HRU00294.1 uroporphyrinogen decarboxylase family protein [Victivallales bacterium]